MFIALSIHQAGAFYIRNFLRSAHGTNNVILISETIRKILRLEKDNCNTDKNGTLQTDNGDSYTVDSYEPAAEKFIESRLNKELEIYSAAPSMWVGLEMAVEMFGLDDLEKNILHACLVCYMNDNLGILFNKLFSRVGSPVKILAAMLGVSDSELEEKINQESTIITSGILSEDPREVSTLTGPLGRLRINSRIFRILAKSACTREQWLDAALGRPVLPSLPWESYEHLKEGGELSAALIQACGTEMGINVMLTGPVGTGKTEFAATLANKTGKSIWSVGEKDSDGNSPNRVNRVASIRLASTMLKGRKDAILLVDEAEDVLMSPSATGTNRADFSKVHLNRMLETNPVPIIWTANCLEEMDSATLRRMSLVIHMGVPSKEVRERIWNDILRKEGLVLTEGAQSRLASSWAVSSALAANAAKVSRIVGGGEAEIQTAISGVARAIGTKTISEERSDYSFDADLSVANKDLGTLADLLSREETGRNWSMCLYGIPGSGKSQFGRYLANRIGMPVIFKRASDLMDKYVGGTEKLIASAFAEAKQKRGLLLIDEVDSMLSERAGAARSWEVSSVNEMLTWMEDHPFPFVATTNLFERIDRAALRRFSFKVRFEALTKEKTMLAFRRFFEVEPPCSLAEGLTPGDFANVLKRSQLLGERDPETLAAWLLDEALDKGAISRNSVGFSMSGMAPVQDIRPKAA